MSRISDEEWKKLQNMSLAELLFNPLAREHMTFNNVKQSDIIGINIYKDSKESEVE